MVQTLESLPEQDRKRIVKDLNDLIQLDHDAVGAYETTIDRLENEEWAATVGQFRGDHERHIRDLSQLVRRLGGEPSQRAHVTGPFKKAMVTLAGVVGDKGVLRAFRTNEMQVKAKYDRYVEKGGMPDEVMEVVRRNAQDEHRHYEWVVGVIGQES